MKVRVAAGMCGAIVLLGPSACASSGSTHAATSSPSTPPTHSSPAASSPVAPPPTTSKPAPAGGPSTRRLAAIVLRASDLPAGWTAAPYKKDPHAAAEDAAEAACVGQRDTDSDKLAEVHSKTFSKGGVSIDSSAISYRSAAGLAVARAVLRSPKWARCWQAEIKRVLPALLPRGFRVVGVTVTSSPSSEQSGIVGVADSTMTVDHNGAQITEHQRSVYFEGRLTAAELDFTTVGPAVPGSLQESLATVVLSRLPIG